MNNKKKPILDTQRIVTAGLLGAICIVLGATGIGLIPVPNLTGRATILHVPVILAGILEGPVVGGLTGLIFGLYSFMTPAGMVPADPIVRILPRILIGVVSAYTFRAFFKKPDFAAGLAAALGTVTNTVGFVGLAILLGYLPWQTIFLTIPQFLVEIVLAVVITIVLVRALKGRIRK